MNIKFYCAAWLTNLFIYYLDVETASRFKSGSTISTDFVSTEICCLGAAEHNKSITSLIPTSAELFNECGSLSENLERIEEKGSLGV